MANGNKPTGPHKRTPMKMNGLNPDLVVYDDEVLTSTFGPLLPEVALCIPCTTPDGCRGDNHCVLNNVTTNPKAQFGAAKATLWGIPASALIALGTVMGGGGYKYGLFNYRKTKIKVSTYSDAMDRHKLLFNDGEDLDPSGTVEGCKVTTPPGTEQSHLIHIMACCALLYDAMIEDKVDDDRNKTGNVRRLLDEAAASLAAFKTAHDAYEEYKDEQDK